MESLLLAGTVLLYLIIIILVIGACISLYTMYKIHSTKSDLESKFSEAGIDFAKDAFDRMDKFKNSKNSKSSKK